MNLGIVQAELQKHSLAENSYYTAIKHRKQYPDCYYNLGNLASTITITLIVLRINIRMGFFQQNYCVVNLFRDDIIFTYIYNSDVSHK